MTIITRPGISTSSYTDVLIPVSDDGPIPEPDPVTGCGSNSQLMLMRVRVVVLTGRTEQEKAASEETTVVLIGLMTN